VGIFNSSTKREMQGANTIALTAAEMNRMIFLAGMNTINIAQAAALDNLGTAKGAAALESMAIVLPAVVQTVEACASSVAIVAGQPAPADDFDEADEDEASEGEDDRNAVSYVVVRVQEQEPPSDERAAKKARVRRSHVPPAKPPAKPPATPPSLDISSLSGDELGQMTILGIKVGQTSPRSSVFEGPMAVGKVTVGQFTKTLRWVTLQAAALQHGQRLYFLDAACTLVGAPIAQTRPAGVSVEDQLRVAVDAFSSLELQKNPANATRLKDWFTVVDEAKFRGQQAQLFASASATLQGALDAL
jgi:hypothetical protein